MDLGFSMQNTLSSQLLLNPWGDLNETWYKERSQCGDFHIARGVLSNVFIHPPKKRAYHAIPLSSVCLSVHPFVPFTLSLQLLLIPWRDLDEALYEERSQFGDFHIARGVMSNVFIRPPKKRTYYAIPLSSVCLCVCPFHFVFATPPKPLGGFG